MSDHGLSTYNNHGCRCEVCRAAKRTYQQAYRDRWAAQGLRRNDSRHGTIHGYTNLGCRCSLCLKAVLRAQRAQRTRA